MTAAPNAPRGVIPANAGIQGGLLNLWRFDYRRYVMSETFSANHSTSLEWGLLLGILLLGAWLRFPHLGRESLWGDEINLTEVAILPSVRETVDKVQLPHSAGYPVFLHYWMKLGRDDPFTRVPSAIAGLLAVALGFFAVRKMANPGAGLAAALFLATSEEQVRFSREVAAYGPQNAVLIGAFLVWLAALRGNRWRDWIGFAALCSISHHLHPLASTTVIGWYLLVPVAWYCGVSNRESGYKVEARFPSLFRWLISVFCFGVSILPQTLKNLEGARKNIGIPEAGAGFGDFFFEAGELGGSGAAPYLLATLVFIGAVILFGRSWFLGLAVVGWSAGTLAVWGAFAWTKATHFDYHYFISHLPAFLILAAIGLDSIAKAAVRWIELSIWEDSKRRASILTVLALAVATPMGVGAYREREDRQWSEYRQAGEFLVSRIKPEDRFYIKPEYWIQNKVLYYLSEVADREVGVGIFFKPEWQEEIREASGTLFIVTRRQMAEESGFQKKVFRGVVINWRECAKPPPLNFMKAYDWTLASAGEVRPDDLLFEARDLENAGQLEFALAVIDRAVNMAPRRFWIVRKRAEILDGMERNSEAAAAFEAAAKIAPPEWEWWMTVSQAENLSKAGDSENAIRLLERVLAEPRKDNQQALVWEVLGACLARDGKWEEAKNAYEKTLELWKGDRIQTLIALGELAERKGDREEAIGFYRRAAAVDKPERAIAEKRLTELGDGP